MTELVTGEAVALDLRTAAVPSRAVAAGLDLLLQTALLLVVGGLFAAGSVDVSEAAGQALGVVLLVVVLAVYPVATETLLRGRTPGKAVMGLRVVRDDGGPIGFRHALVRGLSGAFLEKPGLTFFVLPVVVSLLNPQNKRMGDLLAGTVVVRDRHGRPGTAGADMPGQLADWAGTLELSRLPDDLALSVRQFLARAGDLTPAARDDLGRRLESAVRSCTAPPPPEGTPGWAYLTAVLAERRRRAQDQLRPGPAGPRPTPAARPPAPPPAGAEPERGPEQAVGPHRDRGFAPPS